MKQDEIIEMAIQAGLLEKRGLLGRCSDSNFEAFAKLVASAASAKEREKSNRLLWLFQEWKEDHLSQHNYIEAVEAIRAKGEA